MNISGQIWTIWDRPLKQVISGVELLANTRTARQEGPIQPKPHRLVWAMGVSWQAFDTPRHLRITCLM